MRSSCLTPNQRPINAQTPWACLAYPSGSVVFNASSHAALMPVWGRVLSRVFGAHSDSQAEGREFEPGRPLPRCRLKRKCATATPVSRSPRGSNSRVWVVRAPSPRDCSCASRPNRGARPTSSISQRWLGAVLEEPATTAWFAIELGPSTYGIFDVFPDDGGRDAHLYGKVAGADGERRRTLR